MRTENSKCMEELLRMYVDFFDGEEVEIIGSYEELGILSNNHGLVLKSDGKQFRVTVSEL